MCLPKTRQPAKNSQLTDLGEQVTEDEKKEVESRIADLREVLTGEDKDAIEAKLTALTESSGKIAEKAYAQAQAADGDSGGDAAGGGDAPAGDDVVDAEFEEVKDDNNNK